MKCNYCGYEIMEQEQICKNCGNYTGLVENESNQYFASGQYTIIPQDFMYDPDSGWYYHTEIVQGENGKQEQLVTYYDASNGSYTQARYPLEDENGQDEAITLGEADFKIDGEMESANIPQVNQNILVPEGFLYDTDSGWYYYIEIVQGDNGKQEQLVTYYDASNGSYTQARYPLEDENGLSESIASVDLEQEAIQPVHKETQVVMPEYSETDVVDAEYEKKEKMAAVHAEKIEEYPKVSEIIEQEKAAELININNDAIEHVSEDSQIKSNKKKIVKVISALLVIGILSGGTYILGKQGKIPFLNKIFVVDTDKDKNLQAVAGKNQINSSEVLTQADVDAQWTDNPNCSFLYNSACEDDTSVYFLPDSGFNTSSSRLCRMNKVGGQIEDIISVAATQKPVQSFALLGKFIYFNIEMDDSYSAYFRIPKEGGDAEFLFLYEYSKITAHDGLLYFLFTKEKALGIYNPNEDSRPKLYILNNDYSNYYFLQAFSVCDGYLYYGIHYDDVDNGGQGEAYYKYDLQKQSKELLLSSKDLGEENVMNPFFVDGDAYYIQFDNSSGTAYWRVLNNGSTRSKILSRVTYASEEGDPITAARMGESVLFRMENKFCMAPLNNLTKYNIVYEDMRGPFGISKHWLFLPDRAISADGSRTYNYDNINHVPLGNTDNAYAQAEETLKYTLSDMAKDYNSDLGNADVLEKAIAEKSNEISKSKAEKAESGQGQSWVDKSGYKPKYFTWSKSEYSAQNIDNPEIPSGKWVNESGTVVAYIFYDSSPDVMDFEIFYNGKEYNGYAKVVQDGNSQMALCEEMKIFFHLDTLTGEVLLFSGDNMTVLKLSKAKY